MGRSISNWEIENASLEKRAKWADTKREQAAKELEKVKAAAAALGKEDLGDWEKHSLKLAADIAKQNQLDELETSLKRLFDLSGMNYAIERSIYYSRRAAQRKLKSDE